MAHVICSELSCAHPGGDVLFANVSFRISPGHKVGLVGPNGGGKTHLMRAFAGDPGAHSGEVRIGNRVSIGSFTQLNIRGDFAGRRAGIRLAKMLTS